MVSAVHQKRIEAKLLDCIGKVNAEHGRLFDLPRITWSDSIRTAGTAFATPDGVGRIELSTPYLIEHPDQMIEEIVPHEFGHIVDHTMWPNAHKHMMVPKPMRQALKSPRKPKHNPHGPQWQGLMRLFGLEPSALHDLSLPEHYGHYKWECTGCGSIIDLMSKQNERQIKYGCIKHKKCPNAELIKPGTAKAPVKLEAVVADRLSKLDVCKAIYAVELGRATQDQMIRMFMTKGKCTLAGATTYYHLIGKLARG